MSQIVLRFSLNDNTGPFNALAEALHRETGATIVRLDTGQWVVSGSGIERPVTVLFRGHEGALEAVYLWLGRFEVEFDSISKQVALEMVFEDGVKYRKEGNDEIALHCFERTLEIDDTVGAAWSNRANVLTDLKRWDEAEPSYQRALQCSPANFLIHFNFSGFLLFRGRCEEAKNELRETLNFAPDFEPAKQRLALVEHLMSSDMPDTVRHQLAAHIAGLPLSQ